MAKEKLKKDGTISHQGEGAVGSGQPRKFSSPAELEEYIDKFWSWCEEKGKRPTVTRLAVYLDTNRQTLLNYENADNFNDRFINIDDKEKRRYVDAIKRAKAIIESEYEDALFNKGETVGAIFTLKNNYDWKDKQEVDNNIKARVDNEMNLSGLSVDDIKELLCK